MLDERSSPEQTSYLSIGVSFPMLQAAVRCEIPYLTSQGLQASFEQDIPLRPCRWRGTDTDAVQKLVSGRLQFPVYRFWPPSS